MFKAEWKQLLTNRMLLISTIGMLFIPIIYSGIFLSSSWDPYGRTEKLPVAVVNNDVKTEYEGKTLDIGNELVENLKENDDLDWHFVSKEKAKKGMKDNDYYMVITIPKDFSKNASTVLDEHPQKLKLNYEINPGRGYFIETVSKQATNNLNNEIAESVTKEYVEVIFSQIKEAGDGFAEAADGAQKLDDGTAELEDGNETITKNLKKLASSTLTFKDGAEKIEVGINQFMDGADDLNQGANQLNKGIHDYTAGVGQLKTGADSLASGSSELVKNSPALINGSAQLSQGLQQLLPGAQSLNSGIAQAKSGSESLANGLNELQANAAKLTDEENGIPKLAAGQSELNEGIKDLNAGSEQLTNGLQTLDSSLPNNDQLNQLTAGLESVQSGLNKLAKAVPAGKDMSKTTESLTADLTSAQEALKGLQSSIQNNGSSTLSAIKQTNAFKNMDASEQEELTAAVQKELQQQAGTQQKAAQTLAGDISGISNTLNSTVVPALTGMGELPEGVAQLNDGANKVVPGSVKALNGYGSIRTALENQLIPGSKQLTQGLNNAESGSDQLTTATARLNEQAPQLVSGINQLAEGGNSLHSGLAALNEGSGKLTSGVKDLNNGSTSLQSGISDYANGVSQVGEGAGKIAAGADELNANSAALNNGSASLANGTNELLENLPVLKNGIVQLADGAGELNKGSNKLADGSEDLGDGLDQVKDGTNELADKLADGADQVNEVDASDKNYSMIAAPTKVSEKKDSEVPNYGHALAPYILSLGLYVGALSFNTIFPVGTPALRPANGRGWWFSKFSIGFMQALVSAMIMDVIMLFGMDLQVDHLGEFFLLSALTSMAYMFVIMFLSITLGNPGRFIAMIFLIVQLGGSGGMFPIELTNGFFQAIHPYIPMSYAVSGFRETISSSLGQLTYWHSIWFMIGCMFVFNGLMLLVLSVRKRKVYSAKTETE